MKDERGGFPSGEFCGLTSKMFAYLKKKEGSDVWRKMTWKKKHVRLQRSQDTLFNKGPMMNEMDVERDKSCDVSINKVSLIFVMMKDGFETIVHSHMHMVVKLL